MNRIAGSSPLARGTQCEKPLGISLVRFIPTRAGNTAKGGCSQTAMSVHPHSRGEHCTVASSVSLMSGSSPLARGTPAWTGHHLILTRFIPTRAGNTLADFVCCDCHTVHPHSRGEHASPTVRMVGITGSSPLARGTPEFARVFLQQARFIPTRAGNTWSIEFAPLPRSVHPHSRGEHLFVGQ